MEYHINEKTYNLEEGEGIVLETAGRCMPDTGVTGRNVHVYPLRFHPRLVYGYEGSVFHSKYVEPLVDDSGFRQRLSWKKI